MKYTQVYISCNKLVVDKYKFTYNFLLTHEF